VFAMPQLASKINVRTQGGTGDCSAVRQSEENKRNEGGLGIGMPRR
jgi:hypothetical protein